MNQKGVTSQLSQRKSEIRSSYDNNSTRRRLISSKLQKPPPTIIQVDWYHCVLRRFTVDPSQHQQVFLQEQSLYSNDDIDYLIDMVRRSEKDFEKAIAVPQIFTKALNTITRLCNDVLLDQYAIDIYYQYTSRDPITLMKLLLKCKELMVMRVRIIKILRMIEEREILINAIYKLMEELVQLNRAGENENDDDYEQQRKQSLGQLVSQCQEQFHVTQELYALTNSFIHDYHQYFGNQFIYNDCEFKHALRQLGQGQKISRILAQSLLKTIKSQNRQKFVSSLLDIIIGQDTTKSEDLELIDIATKLLQRNLDEDLVEDPSVIDYVENDFVRLLTKYLENDRNWGQSDNVMSLLSQIVVKFALPLESFMDLESEDRELNIKQLVFYTQLIKYEILNIDDYYMVIKSIIQQNNQVKVIDFFIEIVKIVDEFIAVQDLFNIIFDKFEITNTEVTNKYAEISEIEPGLFQDKIHILIENLSKAMLEDESTLFNFIKIIKDILPVVKAKLTKEEVSIILNQGKNLITLQLINNQNQSSIKEEGITFSLELIKSIDQLQQNPRYCQPLLIEIVQTSIINDSDVNERQSGILMLQVLSRYLDHTQFQEMYPLVMMVILISQFFQTERIIMSTLQVMKHIIQICDVSLIKLYGFDLMQFFFTHLKSKSANVNKIAYSSIITLVREGEDVIIENLDKYQTLIHDIVSQVDKLLDLYDTYEVISSLPILIKVSTDSEQVNKMTQRILKIKTLPDIPIIAVRMCSNIKTIEYQTVKDFNDLIKAFLLQKRYEVHVLKSFMLILKHDLLNEHLTPQKILTLASKLIQEQCEVLNTIDLNFDISEQQEVRFNKSLELVRQSVKILNYIVTNKQNDGLKLTDKDIGNLVSLVKIIQQQNKNYRALLVPLAKLVSNIFYVFTQQEQEVMFEFYFIQCFTSQNIILTEKIICVKALTQIFKTVDPALITDGLSKDIIRFSQILVNYIRVSFKNSQEDMNSAFMELVCSMIKNQPLLSVSLQNVLYNQHLQDTLKNKQKLISFKVSSIKFLFKVLKYSTEQAEKIMNTAFEAFLNFMNDKNEGQLRYQSIKALHFMLCLSKFKKLPKDVKQILDNIQALIMDNQKNQSNDPLISKIIRYCMNIVNQVLKQIMNGDYEGTQVQFDNLKTLINFWLIHVINLERKSHDNFDHIETFITILLNERQVLLGKNNENLSGALKILSLSLTEYCFENDEERKIARLLLDIQKTKPMVFVMAISLLDQSEKVFINKLVETQGGEYDEVLEEDDDIE